MVTIISNPSNTKSSFGVRNGNITGTLSPWANFGSGTAWSFNSNAARCVITSADSKFLRQPFKAKSGVTYNYAFTINISSVGAFSFKMIFMGNSGTQQIVSDGTLSDGSENYTGPVVANNDYDWVAFQIIENIP